MQITIRRKWGRECACAAGARVGRGRAARTHPQLLHLRRAAARREKLDAELLPRCQPTWHHDAVIRAVWRCHADEVAARNAVRHRHGQPCRDGTDRARRRRRRHAAGGDARYNGVLCVRAPHASAAPRRAPVPFARRCVPEQEPSMKPSLHWVRCNDLVYAQVGARPGRRIRVIRSMPRPLVMAPTTAAKPATAFVQTAPDSVSNRRTDGGVVGANISSHPVLRPAAQATGEDVPPPPPPRGLKKKTLSSSSTLESEATSATTAHTNISRFEPAALYPAVLYPSALFPTLLYPPRLYSLPTSAT